MRNSVKYKVFWLKISLGEQEWSGFFGGEPTVIPRSPIDGPYEVKPFNMLGDAVSKLSGKLGFDGTIRVGDGRVFSLGNPSLTCVPSDPVETGLFNRLMVEGEAGGVIVRIDGKGVTNALHGGTWLPASIGIGATGLEH